MKPGTHEDESASYVERGHWLSWKTRRLIVMRPWLFASLLASLYMLAGGSYILISDELSLSWVDSLTRMVELQKFKGLLYVFFTALTLFLLALFFLQWLASAQERLELLQERFLVAERRSAATLVASSLGHDLRNVLMIMGGVLEELEEDELEGREFSWELRHAYEELLRLAERMRSVAEGTEQEDTRSLDLVSLIRDTQKLARMHGKLRRCEIRVDCPEQLVIQGRVSLLQQMLINLLLNAAQLSERGAKILIRLVQREEEICIQVHDDGPGVEEELREQIFEPFFTTRASGSGLGLMSVRLAAKSHHGIVSVLDSKELGGACFEVCMDTDIAESPA